MVKDESGPIPMRHAAGLPRQSLCDVIFCRPTLFFSNLTAIVIDCAWYVAHLPPELSNPYNSLQGLLLSKALRPEGLGAVLQRVLDFEAAGAPSERGRPFFCSVNF